ncbi:hypothetical protein SAMN06265339_0701 [Desulfurobacterium pacificum]|uniref:Porin n=1 Tax=Desulfurobacterium pacificum TaxID=240166 RepID=A0ABY1NJD6_9BACT|nr:hypothetical protein [Desulfurobacterium pacificum]SMP09166.1 hypothetical protein SAMN06265339_0701 [Desulfurobacterium pacificum]
MRKKLLLAGLLLIGTSSHALAQQATILINGVPVKQLYVDSEGRLYLTPGEGRKPVKIEIPTTSKTALSSKEKKIKISGKAFIHYDVDLKNPSHPNAFKLTRNYVELRGYFNKKDYFRTTLDAHQDDDGSYRTRLKYAYVYFSDVLPYTGVELGLAHRPWIDWEEHHGWLHRDVEETFIENHSGAGLINSADTGIDFKGKHGIASWEFGIFNGEGYHGEEESKHFGKSLEGRLSLNLFKGFILSGHTTHIFDLKGENMDRHIYQIHAVYNNPYLLVAAQYIWDKDDYHNATDVKQKGYSINGDLKLKTLTGYPITLFARYDSWNPNTGRPDDSRKHFVYGASYTLNPFVKFSLAQDRKIVKSNGGNDSNTFMAVTNVKW